MKNDNQVRALRYKLSSNVIDLNERLKQKKDESNQEGVKKVLNENAPAHLEEHSGGDDLSRARERSFLQKVQETSGSWMHRFSDVRKDDNGFFIFKADNPAGNKIKPGDELSDQAMNRTPYWKVISIQGDKIRLAPIAPNPFATGKGAGGATLTEHDVSVFTGEHEKKRTQDTQVKLQDGTAAIDDVVYLLDGTVPVNMGPNGAQGGWYAVSDTRSNRGGRKGMNEKQIMLSDAQKLKAWGLSVPVAALSGKMTTEQWNDWIKGSTTHRADYIPKDVDSYVGFHKRLTDEGKYNYHEDSLLKMKTKYNKEAFDKHWEEVTKDFLAMPREDFLQKYPIFSYHKDLSVRVIVDSMESERKRNEEELERASVFNTGDEDNSKESIIKNVFNKERRVSIKNTMLLIEMAKEDNSYVKYLHDILKMGGAADSFASEKIVDFLHLIGDVDGLKLAVKNLKDPDCLAYAYRGLLHSGEVEFVKENTSTDLPLKALSFIYSNMAKGIAGKIKDYTEASIKVKEFTFNFFNEHGILSFINENASSMSFMERYAASNLLANAAEKFSFSFHSNNGYEGFLEELRSTEKMIKNID